MRVSIKVKALALANQLKVETVQRLLNYSVRQACPICLTRGTIKKPLVFDHELNEDGNGEFRGLVCQDCLKMIRFFEYLTKQRPETPLKEIIREIEKRIK